MDHQEKTKLNFQRRREGSGALDAGTGVSIHHFRTESSGPSPPDYLFNIQREGDRVHGMGFYGMHASSTERDGKREWVYPLNATEPMTLEILLGFRKSMPTTEDDFSFLQGLAMGFVLTNSGGVESSAHSGSRFPLVTSVAALSEVGVPLPDHVPVEEDGTVILAEVVIPMKEAP